MEASMCGPTANITRTETVFNKETSQLSLADINLNF